MSDEIKKTASWDEKAQWMRDVGAITAAWSESGELLSVALGPRPAQRIGDEPIPEMSDEAKAVRDLQNMERLMARTSGSLVRRVR